MKDEGRHSSACLRVAQRPCLPRPDAVFIVCIRVVDAAAPRVVVCDAAAVTQLLVVGPLLTKQLSKLI